jgi:hypothetical protein
LFSSRSVSLADSSSSSSEPELEIVETVDLISSSDDEVKKETAGASSRRLPKSKNKTDDRVRAAKFFDYLGKFPIIALERCPSHLPVHVNKVVEKVADDEERIINLPDYPQLRISIVKSS